MTSRLPALPVMSPDRRAMLSRLATTTAGNPPADLARLVREELGADLTARYAGLTIPHPFGKASGQLSSTVTQVQADVVQGIAFVVLKTVIAEDARGNRSMGEWTVQESRMQVEQLRSRGGRDGWTVTWKGRGWPGPLSAYLRVLEDALGAARERDVPVIPSVKYHLPAAGEQFLVAEYEHTTRALLDVWARGGCGGAMLLEKDFSPTLAGDRRAVDRESVLQWVASVPGLIDAAAPGKVRVGMKLMNTLFDDAFQLDMLNAARNSSPPPAFLVVFNRLFDPGRGVAFGGWDLSDRNLRVLDLMPSGHHAVMPLPHHAVMPSASDAVPLCATGNICSGRMMLEYALRGCESGQLHTFFQVPLSQYTATGGGRTARALHTLMLHPTEGLVAWLWHLAESGAVPVRNGVVHFLDCVPAPAS